MSSLIFLLFFLSFFSVSPTSSSFSSVNTNPKCSVAETRALLLFKQNHFSINSLNKHYECKDRLASGYNPVMMNWNTSTNCCDWNGVTCDHSTGDVIGLDLSCGMLQGTIHPNTTLFHLPNLQRLNLAYNDFTGSKLPSNISSFSNSLTHLNVSNCGFMGQVPNDISHLHKLVSLDLSGTWYDLHWVDLNLEPHVLIHLLQNLTVMEELSLEYVNISSSLPDNLNITSPLKLLNLGFTGLQGKLPPNMFNLPSLEKLDLSDNRFTGYIPSEILLLTKLTLLDLSFNYNLLIQPHIFSNLLQNLTFLRDLSLSGVNIGWFLPTYLNISSPIRSLALSDTNLQGKLPHNMFKLQSLEKLDLSGNNFTGYIPSEISLLTKLTSLDLSCYYGIDNLSIQPHIFSNLFQNFSSLRYLCLVEVQIGSVLPTYLNISSPIRYLDLSFTNLQGKLPDNILDLEYLEELYLSSNKNLSGPLPKVNTTTSLPLSWLDLSGTSLYGEIPNSIGHLKSLVYLSISYCGLNGSLPESLSNLKHLEELDLSSNELSGTLPSSLFTLPSLSYISLSNNTFRGNIPLELFSLKSLEVLRLDNNQLTGQIDVLGHGPIGQTFQQLTNLSILDLSNNNFRGEWELDALLSNLTILKDLSLSNSGISVATTNANHYVNPKFEILNLASCGLKVFPVSFRAMTSLSHLDLSCNDIQAHIPDWLGEIGRNELRVLDLSNNSITGTIPDVFAGWSGLVGFILNGNLLEGKVPISLHKCHNLKVIDLGNNHLNDTFPSWLEELPKLQALVLRSNDFHGGIVTSSMIKFPFPRLRVLDLSHNRFVGHLPTKYFQKFNSMKNVVKRNTQPQYLYISSGKYYSIIVAIKGMDRDFPKLLVDYTIVDLSSNNFEGEIPNTIGDLNSLKVLNLAHNGLSGRIPQAIGKISEIESLDLSWNQLTGEIPQSLADLTPLGFLNLSQNHLKGRIPQGKQFNTFGVTSFGGNPKLCGLPLPKECNQQPQPDGDSDGDDDDDNESGFIWKVVLFGYGCGTLLGFPLGYVMLSITKPKWFIAIVDAIEQMILKNQIKRR